MLALGLTCWFITWFQGSQNPKAAAQHGGLSGRPNLNNLDKDDPEILRAWKCLGSIYEGQLDTKLNKRMGPTICEIISLAQADQHLVANGCDVITVSWL